MDKRRACMDVGKHTPAKKLVQFFVIPDGQLEMARIANYPTKLLQVVSPCHALWPSALLKICSDLTCTLVLCPDPNHTCMHAEGPGTRLCEPMQHHAAEATCNYKKTVLFVFLHHSYSVTHSFLLKVYQSYQSDYSVVYSLWRGIHNKYH